MNTNTGGRAIRLLGTTIRISRFILIAFTAIVLVLLAAAVVGRGSMTVNALLDEPFAIEFDDGRRVGISEGIRSYENFEIGPERDELAEVDGVAVSMRIADDDTDSRIVIASMVVLWLAAAWIGLTGLGAVVDTAAAGSAFADENPQRLRWIGVALLASVVTTVVGRGLLETTIDTGLPVRLDLGGSPLWIGAVTGLAMFALAEVFAEAVRLRRFEEATI